MEEKRRKIVKRKVEIENGRRESYKMRRVRRGPFFFFLLLLFFVCFSLFNTTKIGFGCSKMDFFIYFYFLLGKSILRREKNQEKMTLPPQKNFPVTPLVLPTPALHLLGSIF